MTAARSAPTALPGVDEMAAAYDLGTHLNQPIRSLSGGETVKLALAKAAYAGHGGRDLVIASPFCWLARDNRSLLRQLVDQYTACGRTVSILALDGENEDTPAPLETLPWKSAPTPQIGHISGGASPS